MKYYIFRHDWDLNFLESEDPFKPYRGKPFNFGKKMENFPTITLTYKSPQLPDSIPNVNNYIIFNQNIISIIKQSGIDYVQYFDVEVKDLAGKEYLDNYKSLNVLRVIDAIDLEKSKLKWADLDEGETEDDKFILGVLDLRLNYSNIHNEPLFRLKGLESFLIFREDLAQEILNREYTGLEFYIAEGYSS